MLASVKFRNVLIRRQTNLKPIKRFPAFDSQLEVAAAQTWRRLRYASQNASLALTYAHEANNTF